MALNALEAQLREMTQCKICFEDKDNQKQLPCQHTLCLDCLTKLQIDNSKYKCPICNKANFVPNGGFEALADSLITKQLAAILQTRDWGKVATQKDEEENGPVELKTETKQETEAGKKLRIGAQRGKRSLDIAKQKIKGCDNRKAEIREVCKVTTEKLRQLKEEKIAELEKKTQEKIEAAEHVTKLKIEEIVLREAELSAAQTSIEDIIAELSVQAEEIDTHAAEKDVTDELQTASEKLSQLEEVFSPPDATTLRAGDSVRLRMDAGKYTDNFLTSNITHADVGYILEVFNENNKRCSVLFPRDSRFVGQLDWLEKSAVKHNLPKIGDTVRVKATLEKPFFGWGSVKKESVGALREMTNRGPDAGREVVVDFPEQNGWKAIFNDLEVVPPEPLRVGEAVWVRLEVSEPAGGWAGVTHTSKGTLLSVNCDDVLVNFSECKEWRGLVTELERVRPISAGDKVKVSKSVNEPKTGWAGVSHKDEGIVKSITDHAEYGKLATIEFPNRPLLWKCIVSELELVEREAQARTPVSQGDGVASSGRQEIRIPAEVAEMSMRVTQQVMGQHSEQCAQQ